MNTQPENLIADSIIQIVTQSIRIIAKPDLCRTIKNAGEKSAIDKAIKRLRHEGLLTTMTIDAPTLTGRRQVIDAKLNRDLLIEAVMAVATPACHLVTRPTRVVTASPVLAGLMGMETVRTRQREVLYRQLRLARTFALLREADTKIDWVPQLPSRSPSCSAKVVKGGSSVIVIAPMAVNATSCERLINTLLNTGDRYAVC